MPQHEITDLAPADLDWVLDLNRVHEALLSPLDREALAALVAKARLARIVRPVAFLLVLDQNARYDSPNFQWFAERYSRFLYVDRIAVASDAAGSGHGRALYADLFRQADALGHDMICAEVNCDPPNAASLSFHDRLGFRVVGELHLPQRAKTVRCFVRSAG